MKSPATTEHRFEEAPRDHTGVYIPIAFLSDEVNAYLAEFFDTSTARSRFYLLLLALWRHQSVRTANAMAFDLFLALVPMLGVAGWGASWLLKTSGASSRTAFSTLAPADLQGFLGEHFDALSASRLAPLAVLSGWWLSSSAFNTMMGVFEEAFECVPRSFVRRRLVSLWFALLGMAGLAVAGTLGVILAMAPSLVSALVKLLDESGLFKAALLVAAYLALTSFLALLFRYSIRRPDKKRRVWPGAVVASTIGLAASLALGFYATNIARFALFYGGLAVIVVLLLWLWLWSTAILIGAEINVALEDVRHDRLTTLELAAASPND